MRPSAPEATLPDVGGDAPKERQGVISVSQKRMISGCLSHHGYHSLGKSGMAVLSVPVAPSP